MKLGDEFGRSVSISADLISEFAELSQDYNPIHTDDQFARSSGFRGRIAHGNLLGQMTSALVGMDLPTKNVVLLRQVLQFHQPMYVGDKITLRAKVIETSEAAKIVVLKLLFENQDAKKVASGECQIRCQI
ncbi:MAG: MaoC family dehydratase [Bdellovibrionales bacterium]